jgi:hypothetical protein
MKKNEDIITIYWSPSAFNQDDTNWNFLYSDPVSVLADLNTIRNKSTRNLFTCPAYTHSMKNVFVFKSMLEEKVKLDHDFYIAKGGYPFPHYGKSKILLNELRESSLENYVNLTYNMSWLFFADEPVEARFTAPYFPTATPAPGAMLATGQFNIGNWYRDYVLDYHIPVGTDEFVVKEDQPLFYLELRTEKKVVFKRYNMTQELKRIAQESANSPINYEANKTLSYRYNIFKKSSSPERVLSHIKNNLIQ